MKKDGKARTHETLDKNHTPVANTSYPVIVCKSLQQSKNEARQVCPCTARVENRCRCRLSRSNLVPNLKAQFLVLNNPDPSNPKVKPQPKRPIGPTQNNSWHPKSDWLIPRKDLGPGVLILNQVVWPHWQKSIKVYTMKQESCRPSKKYPLKAGTVSANWPGCALELPWPRIPAHKRADAMEFNLQGKNSSTQRRFTKSYRIRDRPSCIPGATPAIFWCTKMTEQLQAELIPSNPQAETEHKERATSNIQFVRPAFNWVGAGQHKMNDKESQREWHLKLKTVHLHGRPVVPPKRLLVDGCSEPALRMRKW